MLPHASPLRFICHAASRFIISIFACQGADTVWPEIQLAIFAPHAAAVDAFA